MDIHLNNFDRSVKTASRSLNLENNIQIHQVLISSKHEYQFGNALSSQKASDISSGLKLNKY